MSQYAEIIDVPRLRELDTLTQSAYITTQARIDAVQDVEEEAAYLLDEARQEYSDTENMERTMAVFQEELERYADMAEDEAQLAVLEEEVLMAYGQTRGMDYRLKRKGHRIDTGYRVFDKDDTLATIQHNAHRAWHNLAEIENRVGRVNSWAEHLEQYVDPDNEA